MHRQGRPHRCGLTTLRSRHRFGLTLVQLPTRFPFTFVRRALAFVFSFFACSLIHAEVFVRWNQAGYRPHQQKVVVIMSEEDLHGEVWRIEKIDQTNDPASTNRPKMEGVFGQSLPASPDHVPFPFHYQVDLSSVTSLGEHRLSIPGATPVLIKIASAPYSPLIPDVLRHLRVMRSGSAETLLRQSSHPGDARALVHLIDGDPALGKWKAAPDNEIVDASGGWYDAGDQIKFTLNIAYTTYHLLLAYRLHPTLFQKHHSRSELPDVLDEALHGLDYLRRVHPAPDRFVIQVGNAEDHHQAPRLPENDALDGRRPALCALSRVHLGSAAAALALGARTFRELGLTEKADRFGKEAEKIFARATVDGAIPTAFERDVINDFYHDPTDEDQMALAAIELYSYTHDEAYLKVAKALAPRAGTEVSWTEWHWLANSALAPHDDGARERLQAETALYANHSATAGGPWGIPGRYLWASLHRWIGAANASRVCARLIGTSPERDAVFISMLDYTFGRNNWGVSFLHSEQLPNTVRNLYSPVYQLLQVFPTGALSEGPGDRATHTSLERYFSTPSDDPSHRFNTQAAVFFDRNTDFMCQEATIGGQADLVLMLTLASL